MLAWKPKSTDPTVASVRYRCLIPVAVLQARGFPVAVYREEDRDRYTGVIFSKQYDREHQALAKQLKARGASVILDLCDNHFYNPEGLSSYRRLREDLLVMIGLADLVVCSTESLADIVQQEAGLPERPWVVGDLVESLAEQDHALSGMKPYLLWFGIHGAPNAPCGMLDILRLAALLERMNREHPFELVVVSNDRKKYDSHIAPLRFPTLYREWETNQFPHLLAGAVGAIIPITPNPFTLSKTHNRLTTALAAAVPVVADGIPSYREFAPYAYLDRWEEGLDQILKGNPSALQMAKAGREYVRERWSPEAVAVRWESVLSPFVKTRFEAPSL